VPLTSKSRETGMLYALLLVLCIALSAASLVCFILVLVKIFQAGQTGLGVVCIILTLCTGIGPLIAFIYGWIKSTEWNLKNVMIVWTLIWVLSLVIIPVFYFQFFRDVSKLGQEMQNQMQQQKAR
jgi:hypothetical protein